AYASSGPNPPAAPVLNATAGNAQVSLSWTTPANGGSAITGYNLYRGGASGGETLYQSLGVVNAYNDTGVTNGQTYYYKVAAVNAAGVGALSNERRAAEPQRAAHRVLHARGDGQQHKRQRDVQQRLRRERRLLGLELGRRLGARQRRHGEPRLCSRRHVQRHAHRDRQPRGHRLHDAAGHRDGPAQPGAQRVLLVQRREPRGVVQRHLLQRPGRQRRLLVVGVRRRRHRQRGHAQPHLRGGRHVQRDAHGHGQQRRHGQRDPRRQRHQRPG